ncbi:aminotransferase class III-fold pyridoxal phosphate-dependent enzyme [Halorussus gelatinilyticus]|uniref:Aminotransferase class III-fold pyridoxal phosphate-dependent enzyme n=1 Tax=Halorussus gelatinilyticus TaxID=2937524 RepID=A0A8U0ILM4_9EURY|nr:aminotransferase class III-fold pyridoxal phosphate-dependent enzyme [Halorussus gelatinilyticus]UPW01586.1 aminotransferase class III-fold pyridoxal phosphate-dependent enzyme [Halorussus gelatinilyticus]
MTGSERPATPAGETPASGSLPHWSDGDDVPTITRGEGVRVSDDEGTQFLDFASQLYCVNAGHSEETIVEAMTEQARRIPYVSSSKHNDARTELAARLADVAPGDLSGVYFAVSGSEANEAAVQFARAEQDAPKVLTRWRSYHGATYGAAALTGDPETRATVERYAATSGSGKFLPPIPAAFDAESPEELTEKAADHLEFVIRNEGPDSVAALLMEPVGGTSGAFPAPPGYFERVRDLCDEYDVLLISDEVITGFGRCGDWFGIEAEGVQPDMITFAKGVTSAYAPLAGVLVRDSLGASLREEGIDVGQTFGGHPVACAAGVAAMDVYEDRLLDNVESVAPTLESELRALNAHEAVSEVRGRGFLWAVEFAEPETGDPYVDPWAGEGNETDDNPVAAVKEAAMDAGVLVGGGRPGFQLIVAPPLCADESDVREAVGVLDDAIGEVFG